MQSSANESAYKNEKKENEANDENIIFFTDLNISKVQGNGNERTYKNRMI